jgi:uncharacterized membrane protein YdbT with pleckstrin-like domain
MSYLEKTLSPSETLLRRGHIHPVFKLRIWALFLVTLAVLSVLAALVQSPFAWVLAAIGGVVAAVFCLRLILPLWTLEIGLTDGRIIIKRGLIAYRTHELELKTIEEVNVMQSWLGRIFDYGTLRIKAIGIDALIIKGIAEPIEFRRAIETALRAVSGPPQAPRSDEIQHAT